MCDSPSSSSVGSASGSGGGSLSSSVCSSSGGGSSSDAADAHIYGVGGYHNIRRGIALRQIGDDFQGLFAEEFIPAGTVLWKNRPDGPAEEQYRKIDGEDLRTLSEDQLKFFIRYSYQNDDEFFISPLCAEEVDLDFSNYWNHSCEPNTLPSDEDHWVAVRDIQPGEQLTIDYATFDSNPFICIERCLCGTASCRKFVRGDDYRIVELQAKYAGHFLPYIQKRMDEEAEVLKSGEGLLVSGVAGGGRSLRDFSAKSVRAFHESQAVDIDAHNRAGLAALMARFAPPEGTNGGRATAYHHGKRVHAERGDNEDGGERGVLPSNATSKALDDENKAPHADRPSITSTPTAAVGGIVSPRRIVAV